jgi:hypothetical protein
VFVQPCVKKEREVRGKKRLAWQAGKRAAGRSRPATHIIKVESADVYVSQAVRAKDELVDEEVAQHRAVAVVPEVFAAGHSSAITSIFAVAVPLWVARGLTLVVVQIAAQRRGEVIVARGDVVALVAHSWRAELEKPARVRGVGNLLLH